LHPQVTSVGQVLSQRALIMVGKHQRVRGVVGGQGENPDEARFRAYFDAKKKLIHVDQYRYRCVTTALYGNIQPGVHPAGEPRPA
jgi:ribosomal protein S5